MSERSINEIKIDIYKTISYRFLGSCLTLVIGYIGSGSLSVGIAVGMGDLLVKPVFYFLHERLWRKLTIK